jgi:hypothetical protein
MMPAAKHLNPPLKKQQTKAADPSYWNHGSDTIPAPACLTTFA